MKEVQRMADNVIAERGVRHGQLVVVPQREIRSSIEKGRSLSHKS